MRNSELQENTLLCPCGEFYTRILIIIGVGQKKKSFCNLCIYPTLTVTMTCTECPDRDEKMQPRVDTRYAVCYIVYLEAEMSSPEKPDDQEY